MIHQLTRIFMVFLSISISGCRAKENVSPRMETRKLIANDASPSNQQVPLLGYQDEWNRNNLFVEFRSRLLRSLEQNNQDSILSLFSNRLQFNPGTEKGKAGVIEVWSLDGSSEKLKPLVDVIKNLIETGGCFRRNDSAFYAPYYNCLSDAEKSDCDESGCGVVIREGSDFRKDPKPDSPVSGKVAGNEIVKSYRDTACTSDFTRCEWRKIERANGQSVFVKPEKIQTLSEGFIAFSNEPGGWKIRSLRHKSMGIPFE